MRVLAASDRGYTGTVLAPVTPYGKAEVGRA